MFFFCICIAFPVCSVLTWQPIDNKRDQFRKYIESKGVIDTITKVLVKLLEAPVKPEHPIDFIRDNLGPTIAEQRRVEGLEQQVADYKKEVSHLKSQIEELKVKLDETSKPMVNGTIDINKPDDQSISSSKDSVQANEPNIQDELANNYGAENTDMIESGTAALSITTNDLSSATTVENGENTECGDSSDVKVDDKVSSEESKDSNAIAPAENADVVSEKSETKN